MGVRPEKSRVFLKKLRTAIGLNDLRLLTSIAVLSGISLFLFKQKQTLFDQLKDARQEYLRAACIKPGDIVPNLMGLNLEGYSEKILDTSSNARIIQVVSMNCAASKVQITDWWPTLVSDPRLKKVNPLLIAIESRETIQEKLEPRYMQGRILACSTMVFRRSFRVTQAPITLLVSSNGKVLWTHNGVLTQNQYDDLVAHASVDH